MSIDRIGTPEEQELARKLKELALLEGELTQMELRLTTAEAELEAFNDEYLRTVGVKFTLLDGINAEIAEFLASTKPDDLDARDAARAAREKAQTTANEAAERRAQGEVKAFSPTDEIQDLYRRVAKRVHPDLAVSEADRVRRTEVMAEVNRAYQEGDVEKLLAILQEWDSSPEAIEGEDVGSRLVRTIRMIARVRRRISRIKDELRALEETDLYVLKSRVDEAARQGRDLLQELAADVEVQIERAQLRLRQLQSS